MNLREMTDLIQVHVIQPNPWLSSKIKTEEHNGYSVLRDNRSALCLYRCEVFIDCLGQVMDIVG